MTIFNSNDLNALFWYIENYNIQIKNSNRLIIYNAVENSKLKIFNNPLCIQRFYPDYKRLSDLGYYVAPVLPINDTFDGAIFIASKHKEDNLYAIAQICNMLDENGILIIISRNETGGKSLTKYASQLLGAGENENKHHCRIFKTYKKKKLINDEMLNQFLDYGKPKSVGQYFTSTGVFSEGKIDIGSQFLIDTITKINISGDVADFGAGWGYLSGEVLRNNKEISSITLIEADYCSLELAKQAISSSLAEFIWSDVLTNDIYNKYDAIITNPPFHYGSFTDSNIGIQFIESAYDALRYDRTLYLVANKKLPYENTIEALFGNIKILDEKDGYKVISAVKLGKAENRSP